MEENEGNKEVHLKGTKEIELPSIDVSAYIGKDAEIETVTEHEGQFGFFILVKTNVLDTIEVPNKEPIELRASRLFSLQQDDEGNIGWGKNTQLGMYLKKMKVEHYEGLIGKDVKVQTMTNKKNGKEYLTF